MAEIVFITVNYKNSAMTERFVSSVNNCIDNSNSSIQIVDNQSTKKSADELNIIGDNSVVPIKIIPSEKNRYYWGGAALAVDTISFNNSDDPSWIIIANNDIVFYKEDFITRLSGLNPKDYPIIAPKITLQDTGKNQNPHLIDPLTMFHKMYYSIYYSHFITAKLVHKTGRLIHSIFTGKNRTNSLNKEMKIYAPHGSCIIFSKEYFRQGGNIDGGFSFYGEELSVAEIAREIDLPVTYIPDLEVLHNEHASTSSRDWLTAYNQSRETYRYLRKKYIFK